MRILILLILLISCITKGHTQYDEYVLTSKIEGKTFSQIINILESNYPINISYSDKVVDADLIHQFSFRNLRLEDVIRQISEHQNISYLILKDKILFVDNIPEIHLKEKQVYGLVKDLETGEVLIGANIISNKREVVSITNNFGYYTYWIAPDIDSISISYIGYQPKRISVRNLSGRKDFALKSSLTLEEIIVTPENNSKNNTKDLINTILLSPEDNLFGENDILQSVKKQASIQSGGEVQSNIIVRGGGTDQNLILLDGTPLYEVNHLLGIASIFNNDAINNTELSTSGFSAKYGGRLSSVINIDLKNGNLFKHKASFNLGLLGTRFHLEGPIIKGFSSFNLSVRKSHINFFIDPLAKRFLSVKKTYFNFEDLNLKAQVKLFKNGNLYISGYWGADNIGFKNSTTTKDGPISVSLIESDNSIRWKNSLFVARYRHIFGEKLFSNISVSHVGYDLYSFSDNEFKNFLPGGTTTEVVNIYAFSSIFDYNIRNDWEYNFSNDHNVKFGGGYTDHLYNPTIRERELPLRDGFPSFDDFNSIPANEYFTYFEDNYKFNTRWQLISGIHMANFNVEGESFFSFQPRLKLIYTPNPTWYINANYSKMTQFVHLLVNPGIGLPSDLWVPSTSKIPPQEAEQYTIQIQKILNKDLRINGSLFYKSMKNLVEYRTAFDLYNPVLNNTRLPIFNNSRDWEDRVEVGKGRAYGFDISTNLHYKKFDFILNYAHGYSFRQFEKINKGNPFPYKYDRRHDLTFSCYWKINKSLNFNANWIFGTGHATSIALTEFEDEEGNPILDYSQRNNLRLPNFHKLDLHFKYQSKWLRTKKLTISGGIQNVYNRKNTYYIYVYQDPNTKKYYPKKVSVFPILPFVNLTFYL